MEHALIRPERVRKREERCKQIDKTKPAEKDKKRSLKSDRRQFRYHISKKNERKLSFLWLLGICCCFIYTSSILPIWTSQQEKTKLSFFVEGYSKYYLEDEYCEEKLDIGTWIMGKRAKPSSYDVDNLFTVRRYSTGQKITNGEVYEAGDYYKITYLGRGQHVFEIKGGELTDSYGKSDGCDFRRSVSTTTYLAMPMGTNLPDIELWCGHTNYKGTVEISEKFVLKSPEPSLKNELDLNIGEDDVGEIDSKTIRGEDEDIIQKNSESVEEQNLNNFIESPDQSIVKDRVAPSLKGGQKATINVNSNSDWSGTFEMEDNVKMSWSADVPSGDTTPDKITIQLEGKPSGWVSIGIIEGESNQMYSSDNPRNVLIFPDSNNEPNMYYIGGNSASSMTQLTSSSTELENTWGIDILAMENSNEKVSVTFTIDGSKSSQNLLNISGANKIIYASATSAYPAYHSNRGTGTVQWSTGSSIETNDQKSILQVLTSASPLWYYLFFVLCAVLLWISRESDLRDYFIHTRVGTNHIYCKSQGEPKSILESLDSNSILKEIGTLHLGEILFLFGWIILEGFYLIAGIWTDTVKDYMTLNHSCISRFGLLALFNVGLTLLPVTKQSLWLYLYGIPFERAIKFHRMVASASLMCMVGHIISISTIIPFGSLWFDSNPYDGGEYTTLYGLLAFICFLLPSLFAYESLRRSMYEVFKYIHYIIFIGVFYIFLHIPAKLAAAYLAPPLILYFIDILARLHKRRNNLNIEAVTLINSETIAIKASNDDSKLSCAPGKYFYLNIPKISNIQWHPISLAATSLDSDSFDLEFIIKSVGHASEWTTDLIHQNGSGKSSDLIMNVEGPYGDIKVDVSRYEKLIFVAGGIGITPISSLLKYIARLSNTERQHIKLIKLVWVVKGVDGLLLMSYFADFFRQIEQGIQRQDGIMQNFEAVEERDTNIELKVIKGADKTESADGKRLTLLDVDQFITGNIDEEVGAKYKGVDYTFGRPPLEKIFSNIRERDSKEEENAPLIIGNGGTQYNGQGKEIKKTVGVVACGPGTLVNDVRSLCDDNKFHFHEEIFHW